MKTFISICSIIACTFSAQAQSSIPEPQATPEFRQLSNVSFLPGKGTTNYPQFMNGKHGLAEYIKNEIKYPEDAKNQGITGIAIVEYTINKNGEVVGVKKAKNSVDNDLLVDELIRVVEKSNPWLPGTVEDKPEKMTLTVSYEFVLTGK